MTPDEQALLTQAIWAFLLVYVGLVVVISLVSYVAMAITMSMFFRKVGVEPWIAWVPVYGYWKLLEVGGTKGSYALFTLVPFAGIVTSVFLYIGMYRIGYAFRKDGSWMALAIFFPYAWFALLARATERYEPSLQAMTGYPPLAGSGVGVAAPVPDAPPAYSA
jgi:hypothetical protein